MSNTWMHFDEFMNVAFIDAASRSLPAFAVFHSTARRETGLPGPSVTFDQPLTLEPHSCAQPGCRSKPVCFVLIRVVKVPSRASGSARMVVGRLWWSRNTSLLTLGAIKGKGFVEGYECRMRPSRPRHGGDYCFSSILSSTSAMHRKPSPIYHATKPTVNPWSASLPPTDAQFHETF